MKPGPVDPLKGGLFAGKSCKAWLRMFSRHLLRLRQAEAPVVNFGEGQVHQKP